MEKSIWENVSKLHKTRGELAEVRWLKTGDAFFKRSMLLESMIAQQCAVFASEVENQHIRQAVSNHQGPTG
jgi:hypothetical protein